MDAGAVRPGQPARAGCVGTTSDAARIKQNAGSNDPRRNNSPRSSIISVTEYLLFLQLANQADYGRQCPAPPPYCLAVSPPDARAEEMFSPNPQSGAR